MDHPPCSLRNTAHVSNLSAERAVFTRHLASTSSTWVSDWLTNWQQHCQQSKQSMQNNYHYSKTMLVKTKTCRNHTHKHLNSLNQQSSKKKICSQACTHHCAQKRSLYFPLRLYGSEVNSVKIKVGEQKLNVPLETLYAISGTVLQARWPNQQCRSTDESQLITFSALIL